MSRRNPNSSSTGNRMAGLLRHSLAALAVVIATTSSAQADISASFRGNGNAIQHYILNEQQARQEQLRQSQRWDRRLDAADQQAAAVNKANEVGASVRKAVKQLRGGNDKFYRDLITAVKITMCEQLVNDKSKVGPSNPSTRFVPPSDENAYKDDDGKCIRVIVTANSDEKVVNAYKQGDCEVKPNCYWGKFNATDLERQPVYSNKEGTPAPDGAMSATDAKALVTKWGQGLMVFVVPGIILAVLSLLTMIFFLLCRCCCNRCGGRKPKEGGYTCMQKFYPLFFFLLFAVGVVAVAGISLLYQKTVTSAISDTFVATSDTLTNAHSWVVNISTPLENVRDTVVDSSDKIKVQLAGSDFIEVGIDGVTTQLEEFGQYSANRTLPSGCTLSTSEPYCIPCDACTTISTEVGQSTKQMRDNAGSGIQTLKDVRGSLNTMLVDIADSVKNTVNSFVDMAAELIKTIDSTQKQVVNTQKQYEAQKAPQQGGVLVLFALSLVVIAIGFIGILFGLTPLKFLANIIHLAYIIGFIALFLTFLISAIFLAISVVLGDVCEVTTILSEDWTTVLGEPAKGLNACFKNESLIDTFNLSSSLEFARGGIKFPEGTDLNTMLDFSSLDTFSNTIQSTTTGTFNTTGINDLLTILNDYATQSDNTCTLSDVYTLNNILTPWAANGGTQTGSETGEEYIASRYASFDNNCPQSGAGRDFACKPSTTTCTFSVFMVEAYHNVSMLAMVQRDSGQFITDLHNNMTKVTDYTAAFKANTTTLDGNIKTIQHDLEDSLIKQVDKFEDAMYCTFLADGYYKLYAALCGKLMPAFTMISLMLFLAGIFLFPVNVCLIIALKRLKAKGNGSHVMDTEMKFK